MTTIPRGSLLFNKGNIGPQTRGHKARQNLKTWLKKKAWLQVWNNMLLKEVVWAL